MTLEMQVFRHDFFPLLRSTQSDFLLSVPFFQICRKPNFFVSVPIVSELRNSQILLQRVIWLVQYFISSNDKFFLQYWPQSCLVLFRHVGMSSRVVVDGDFNTKTLDKALKNVWKWEWLEKKVWEELIAIKT